MSDFREHLVRELDDFEWLNKLPTEKSVGNSAVNPWVRPGGWCMPAVYLS